jgi:simple sugar transport system ATP-binding protein
MASCRLGSAGRPQSRLTAATDLRGPEKESTSVPAARPAPTEPVISLSGITKRFPGVVANDHLSFDLYAGEVHVLLGENGAGKSTLIGILAGVLRPDEGSITIRGQRVTVSSPRDAIALGIGTVYQHATLVPSMTVAENLMLGQRWYRPLGRQTMLGRLAKLSQLLGIVIDSDAPAGALSLGQQQQVEIIKALWRGERILILDEPTSMLTPQGVKELGATIGRLRADGLAVVFITHKLHEALAFGDRVSILKLGRLVGQLDPATLRGMSPEVATGYIVERMFGQSERRSAAEFTGATGLRGKVPPDAGLSPILALDAVSTAADNREVALDGVSLVVRSGEVFGIGGVDGNGQRQLAEAIAGQRGLVAGRIRFNGIDVTKLNVGQRQRLGLRYLTDDRLGEGTIGSFAVALNFVLKCVGDPPFWRRSLVQQQAIVQNAVDLIARYDVRTPGPLAPIASLSGGNIQKALFGRELAMEPKLVVYNKPTSGLDVAGIRTARRRIRDAADAGIAAVLISTELEELLELSDRIGVMNGGRLVAVVDNDESAETRVSHLMVGGALQ